MSTYTKHLSEPWFTLIKLGLKTCEGRLNKGDFEKMNPDDSILFENNDYGLKRSFLCKITSIHNYESFREYLSNETLEKCLPGIDTIEDGVEVYHQYYNPSAEAEHKIKAIILKVVENNKPDEEKHEKENEKQYERKGGSKKRKTNRRLKRKTKRRF